MVLYAGFDGVENPALVEQLLDYQSDDGPRTNRRREMDACLPELQNGPLGCEVGDRRHQGKSGIAQDERLERHTGAPTKIQPRMASRHIQLDTRKNLNFGTDITL